MTHYEAGLTESALVQAARLSEPRLGGLSRSCLPLMLLAHLQIEGFPPCSGPALAAEHAGPASAAQPTPAVQQPGPSLDALHPRVPAHELRTGVVAADRWQGAQERWQGGQSSPQRSIDEESLPEYVPLPSMERDAPAAPQEAAGAAAGSASPQEAFVRVHVPEEAQKQGLAQPEAGTSMAWTPGCDLGALLYGFLVRFGTLFDCSTQAIDLAKVCYWCCCVCTQALMLACMPDASGVSGIALDPLHTCRVALCPRQAGTPAYGSQILRIQAALWAPVLCASKRHACLLQKI